MKEKSDKSKIHEDPSEVEPYVSEEKGIKLNPPPTGPRPQKTKSSNNQNNYTGNKKRTKQKKVVLPTNYEN